MFQTGFRSARQAARRVWLILGATAVVPGLAVARIVPGFFCPTSPSLLSDGAPNIWSIVQLLPWVGSWPLAGLAMATGLGAAAWLAALFSARPPRGDTLASAVLLVSLVLPGLLPQMHAGDFLFAVALGGIWGIGQRQAAIPALIISGWLLAISGFAALGAPPVIIATLLVSRRFLVLPANDNGLPLNPVTAYPA